MAIRGYLWNEPVTKHYLSLWKCDIVHNVQTYMMVYNLLAPFSKSVKYQETGDYRQNLENLLWNGVEVLKW